MRSSSRWGLVALTIAVAATAGITARFVTPISPDTTAAPALRSEQPRDFETAAEGVPSGTTSARRRAAATPEALPGIIVVKLADDATPAALADALGVPESSLAELGDRRVEVQVPAGSSADAVIADAEASGKVEFAEREYLRRVAYAPPTYPAAGPNDTYSWGSTATYMSTPWATRSWWQGENGLGMQAAWPAGLTGGAASTTGLRASGSTIRVAVIDSGFYLNHPDKGNVVGRYDFCNSWDATTLSTMKKDSDVTPPPIKSGVVDAGDVSHGTAVAGEIAAAANNARGTTGAGWDQQVYFYKVMGYLTRDIDMNGDGKIDAYHDLLAGQTFMLDSAIEQAIRKAADDGCKVINLSLGAPGRSSSLESAINYARSKGAIVVAATGNDGFNATGTNDAFYPAAAPGVIGVGAYDVNTSTGALERAVWGTGAGSNYGYGLDLYAPGTYVYTLSHPTLDIDGSGPVFSTGYGWWTGTSMASPAAAAGISWLWRAAPALSATQVETLVLSSAKPVHVDGSASLEPKRALDVAAGYAKLVADYPLLASPAIVADDVVAARDVPVTWSPVGGTSVTYTVALDGTTVSSGSTAVSATLRDVADGTHTVTVQAKSAYNWYDTGSLASHTFVVDATPPAISSLAYGNGVLTWAHNKRSMPHTATVEIDGDAPFVVDGEGVDVTSLSDGGSHEATLTVFDAVGRTTSRTLGFTTIDGAPSDSVTLSTPSPSTVTYRWSSKLTATGLRAGAPSSLGGLVEWESSRDGKNWSPMRSVATTASTTATWYKPTYNTYVRARIPGAAPSNARRILVRASMSTPGMSSPKVKRWSSVYGQISPRHTPGSRPVKVLVQRKVGRTWRTVTNTSVKTSDGYKWKFYFKPTARGLYRIRSGHADSSHVQAYSKFRYVTVR